MLAYLVNRDQPNRATPEWPVVCSDQSVSGKVIVKGSIMRAVAALVAALSLLAAIFAPVASVEAANCQFISGFRTLRFLIPSIVGDCLENQHVNPANGDWLQMTTGGLLVQREADHRMAFTDGNHTWVLGPNGLEERLAQDRFPWEPDECAAGPRITTISWSFGPDGSRVARGTVANPCNKPVGIIVDFIAADPTTGQPLADAPSLFASLRPGQDRVFVEDVRSVPRDAEVHSHLSWFDASTSAYCFAVDSQHCVTMDPWLSSSAGELATLPEGRWLLRVAADNGVSVITGSLPSGDVGGYMSQPGRLIVLSRDLLQESSWVRAATLAHELQHAADDAANLMPAHPTPEQCLSQESRAFAREAQVWDDLWAGHLPPNLDARHAALNTYARQLARDPRNGALNIARQVDTGCAAGTTLAGTKLP